MSTHDELKKLKVFTINRLNRMKRQIEESLSECKQEKSQDDFLTVKQVIDQYGYSAKTIYRWKNKGLQVYQREYKGTITIKRINLENYLKKGSNGRLF
jgi:hypothetical protein